MTLWAHGGTFSKLCEDRFGLGQPFTCAYGTFYRSSKTCFVGDCLLRGGKLRCLQRCARGSCLPVRSVLCINRMHRSVEIEVGFVGERMCTCWWWCFWVRCPACVYFVHFYEYMGVQSWLSVTAVCMIELSGGKCAIGSCWLSALYAVRRSMVSCLRDISKHCLSSVTGCMQGVLNGVQAVCVGSTEWGIEDGLLAAEFESVVVPIACCRIPTHDYIVDWERTGDVSESVQVSFCWTVLCGVLYSTHGRNFECTIHCFCVWCGVRALVYRWPRPVRRHANAAHVTCLL